MNELKMDFETDCFKQVNNEEISAACFHSPIFSISSDVLAILWSLMNLYGSMCR